VNFTFLLAICAFGFSMYSRIMASLETWLAVQPLLAVLFFALAGGGLYAGHRLRRLLRVG
jgi:hypothetical protein